jgi:hypothetical protein
MGGVHTISPSTHRLSRWQKSPQRSRRRLQFERPVPLLNWLRHADHRVAPIRRSVTTSLGVRRAGPVDPRRGRNEGTDVEIACSLEESDLEALRAPLIPLVCLQNRIKRNYCCSWRAPFWSKSTSGSIRTMRSSTRSWLVRAVQIKLLAGSPLRDLYIVPT